MFPAPDAGVLMQAPRGRNRCTRDVNSRRLGIAVGKRVFKLVRRPHQSVDNFHGKGVGALFVIVHIATI